MREQLFDLAIEPLDEARRYAYIGHLLLRVLDWPIATAGQTKWSFGSVRATDSFLPDHAD